MAVAIPELDAGIPFLLQKRWFPLVMTSPATMYVTLLTAASHYCALNSLLQTPHIQSILLDLKQACLESINREMRAHPASTSMPDTVVGAVAKMASYEAMFGTGASYHTHMRGLTSIITQRGGLGSLGLGGLLMRMVLWIDINSAFILGGKTYFETTAPLAGHVGFMQPNPMNFLSIFGRGEGEATGLVPEGVDAPAAGDAGVDASGAGGRMNGLGGRDTREVPRSIRPLDAREQQYRDYLDQTGQVHAVFEEEDDVDVRRGTVWTACGGNIKVPRQENVVAAAAAATSTTQEASTAGLAPEPTTVLNTQPDVVEGVSALEGMGATNPMTVQEVHLQQQDEAQNQQYGWEEQLQQPQQPQQYEQPYEQYQQQAPPQYQQLFQQPQEQAQQAPQHQYQHIQPQQPQQTQQQPFDQPHHSLPSQQ